MLDDCIKGSVKIPEFVWHGFFLLEQNSDGLKHKEYAHDKGNKNLWN